MDTPEGRCSELREEFRLVKFGLHHDDPSLFVKPQCFKPKFYILWTTFWAIFYIAMLSLDIYYNIDFGGEYFYYLTNWSYLLQAAHVFLDFFVTVYVYCRRKDIRDGKESGTTWYLKSIWVVFNVSNSVSILVTIVYYALLEIENTHGSINKHLLNSVYTLLTLIFCAKPVQILHFYHPAIYGVVYVIFSIVHHLLGNDPIYDILDWSDTGSAVLLSCLITFVGIPVTHLLTFAIYTLRKFMFYSCECFGKRNEENKREITACDVVLQDAKTCHSRNSVEPGKDKY